jgi:hypothetical protein
MFKNPLEFLLNIAWRYNIDKSYFIDWKNDSLISLREAPEWVLTNLYLLNLGDLDIQFRGKINNLTPFELLNKSQLDPDDEFFAVGIIPSSSTMYRFNFLHLDTPGHIEN